jgi:sarcosine oxidase
MSQVSGENMDSEHYEVIVIGVGSMGSATCSFLSSRGHRVLGLEQFDSPHDLGSHTGQSRIIRKAYFEHPDYVPLLDRAYANWSQLEKETGKEIFHRTGIVYFGQPDHETMRGVQRSASLYHVPVKKLAPDQSKKQFPLFEIPAGFETLIESDAGFVAPEEMVRLYCQRAIANGATIRTREKVIKWSHEGNVITVITDRGKFICDRLIITAGSWTSKVTPALATRLKVTRQVLAWVDITEREAFSLGKFPCWFIQDPGRGMYYGFPALPPDRFHGPSGLKLAHHHPGEITDPDKVERDITPEDEENIRYALRKYLPSAGERLVSMKTCLYTYTPDENFIIDHLPGYSKQITIACGFSGHGFKFVSVVGEILADLAMKGKTELPIDFLKLDRFSKKA